MDGHGGLPLAGNPIFHTTDVDQAREEVAKIFCPHLLHLNQRNGRLNARQHSVRLRQVCLNYVQYGGSVYIEPGELETFYLVEAPLTGTAEVTCGTKHITSTPGLASVPTPAEHLSMKWQPDCGQLITRIEKDSLETELRDLLDAPITDSIRFDLGMDLTSGLGASWWNLVEYIVADIDAGDGMTGHDLTVAGLEASLMTGLLTAQPHNYTHLLNARTPMPAPRAVRVAVDMIETHPDTDLTVTKLARRAHVSVRALQAGFRRHLDTTPTAYLRKVRMARARADLQQFDPTDTTVSYIARNWGFLHLGRFSTEYRKRYGEPPSRTLHHHPSHRRQ